MQMSCDSLSGSPRPEPPLLRQAERPGEAKPRAHPHVRGHLVRAVSELRLDVGIVRRRLAEERPFTTQSIGELEAAVHAPGIAEVEVDVGSLTLAEPRRQGPREARRLAVLEILQRVEAVRPPPVGGHVLLEPRGIHQQAELEAMIAGNPRQLIRCFQRSPVAFLGKPRIPAERQRCNARGAVEL
jgi:hypothetical protein